MRGSYKHVSVSTSARPPGGSVFETAHGDAAADVAAGNEDRDSGPDCRPNGRIPCVRYSSVPVVGALSTC